MSKLAMSVTTHFLPPLFGEQSVMFDSHTYSPERETRGPPILLVCGFGKTPDSYIGLIRHLARSGRQVIAIGPLVGEAARMTPINERFPLPQDNRASAIITVLMERNFGPVDVVAHSEGCINVLIAAQRMPELFRHFIFFGAPGFTGRESYLRIIWRGVHNGLDSFLSALRANEDERRYRKQMARHTRAWMKKRSQARGTLSTIIESMQPGRILIVDIAQHLRRTGHQIVVIASDRDRMVSLKQFGAGGGHLGISRLVPIAGGHDAPCIDPYSCSPILLAILSTL